MLKAFSTVKRAAHRLGAAGKIVAQVIPYACSGRANIGFCPICERKTVFLKLSPWLRDDYRCRRCGSIPRFRALIIVLNTTYPQWRSLSIHESSPGSPSSDKIARDCPRYVPTQFFPDTPLGSCKNGVRCENLEAMTFEDASFDLVITQDVLEHVFHPEAAFAEIRRTLKPGGAHIFTVPVFRGRQTLVRAVLSEQGVEYREPPDYHGNPIDEAGSLVTREWGEDIIECIRESSGLETEVFDFHDPSQGLVAEFLQVYVSRKPL